MTIWFHKLLLLLKLQTFRSYSKVQEKIYKSVHGEKMVKFAKHTNFLRLARTKERTIQIQLALLKSISSGWSDLITTISLRSPSRMRHSWNRVTNSSSIQITSFRARRNWHRCQTILCVQLQCFGGQVTREVHNFSWLEVAQIEIVKSMMLMVIYTTALNILPDRNLSYKCARESM